MRYLYHSLWFEVYLCYLIVFVVLLLAYRIWKKRSICCCDCEVGYVSLFTLCLMSLLPSLSALKSHVDFFLFLKPTLYFMYLTLFLHCSDLKLSHIFTCIFLSEPLVKSVAGEHSVWSKHWHYLVCRWQARDTQSSRSGTCSFGMGLLSGESGCLNANVILSYLIFTCMTNVKRIWWCFSSVLCRSLALA